MKKSSFRPLRRSRTLRRRTMRGGYIGGPYAPDNGDCVD